MTETIKRLPENAKSFEADGRKFIVHDTLTTDGFQMLEELRIRAEVGDTSGGLLKNIQKGYGLLNEGKFADAAVVLYNAIATGERLSEKQYSAWMLIVTLFVRPEGSNLSAWNESEAAEWITAWNNEGYASDDLFRLAADSQMRYTLAFAPNSPSISGSSADGEAPDVQPAANRKRKRSLN